MSKLGRKAKQQKKTEEKMGKKAMLYLVVGLIVFASILGFLINGNVI